MSTDSSARSGGSFGGPVLAFVLLVVVAGLVWPGGSTGAGDPHDRTRPAAYAGKAIGGPDRIVLPALDVSAAVTPIELSPDGVLTPPGDVDTVGWWRRSAEPGAHRGQVLLTGHTVHQGDGALDHIGRLDRGDRIRIESGRRKVGYRVDRVAVLSTDKVAQRARGLFGQGHGSGRLVLVTCTDWNGVDYESNVIVFAHAVAAR